MLKSFKFSSLLEIFAFVLMASLIIIMVVQIFARQFLSSVPTWSGEETANFLLIWTVNIGAALAAGKNSHLAVDYFVSKFSLKKQRIVEVFVFLIVSIFLVMIAYISFQLAWSGRFTTTARLNLSMFWFQISFSVGSVIMLFYYVKYFIANLRTLKNNKLNEYNNVRREE